jgi:hypothetical protein
MAKNEYQSAKSAAPVAEPSAPVAPAPPAADAPVAPKRYRTAPGIRSMRDPYQDITFGSGGCSRPTELTSWVEAQLKAGLLVEA